MPLRSRPVNGDSHDDDDSNFSDRELARAAIRLAMKSDNRSLDVYTQIGSLVSTTENAVRMVTESRNDVREVRKLMERNEAINELLREAIAAIASNGGAAGLPPMRGPLPSYVEERAEDSAEMRDVRSRAKADAEKLAALLDRDAAEIAVKAADDARVRRLGLYLGIVIALTAVAGIVWQIVRVVVANAK